MRAALIERSGTNLIVRSRGWKREVPYRFVALDVLKTGKILLVGTSFSNPPHFIPCLGFSVIETNDFAQLELRADFDHHGAATAYVHGVDVFVERLSGCIGAEDSNWDADVLARLSTRYHDRMPIFAK